LFTAVVLPAGRLAEAAAGALEVVLFVCGFSPAELQAAVSKEHSSSRTAAEGNITGRTTNERNIIGLPFVWRTLFGQVIISDATIISILGFL
jgi:hypothetical protein